MSFYPRRQVIDGDFNVLKNLNFDSISANSFVTTETPTVASSTPIVLTSDSTQVQTITGTVAQVVQLPIVAPGNPFTINSQTVGGVTVKAADGTVISVIPVGGVGVFRPWIDGANDKVHWVGDVRLTDAAFSVFNNELAITHGGTQTAWFLPATPAPAASTLAEWDVQSNLSADAFLSGQTPTASSSTPIALTLDSKQVQVITGTTTPQTMLEPTTAIKAGFWNMVINQMSTASVTVQASDGSTIGVLGPGEIGVFKAGFDTPTTNTQWSADIRAEGVTFKVKTGEIDIRTAGSLVTYALPAASTTLLGTDDSVPAATHAATSKSTPVDADELPLADSAASFGLKKLTWANLKAAIKSYYDSVVSTLTNKDLTSGTNTFPTLNQNTSGTAAGLSSTLAIASGGTGAVTAAAALAALAASGVPNTLLPDGIVNANSGTQFVGTVAGTNVYIANSQLALPATYLQGMTAPSGSGGTVKCGTTFKWRVVLSKNVNGTGSFNFLIFRGVNGTTADTIDVTQIIGAAMTAVIDTLVLDVQLTVLTTGAAGSYFWTITTVHSAASGTGFGIGSAVGAPNITSGTVTGVAMNTASLVFGLGFVAGAGGTMPNVTAVSVQANAFNID